MFERLVKRGYIALIQKTKTNVGLIDLVRDCPDFLRYLKEQRRKYQICRILRYCGHFAKSETDLPKGLFNGKAHYF